LGLVIIDEEQEGAGTGVQSKCVEDGDDDEWDEEHGAEDEDDEDEEEDEDEDEDEDDEDKNEDEDEDEEEEEKEAEEDEGDKEEEADVTDCSVCVASVACANGFFTVSHSTCTGHARLRMSSTRVKIESRMGLVRLARMLANSRHTRHQLMSAVRLRCVQGSVRSWKKFDIHS
jgi:hypothetical protein